MKKRMRKMSTLRKKILILDFNFRWIALFFLLILVATTNVQAIILKDNERLPDDFQKVRLLLQKYSRDDVEKYLRDFVKSGNPNRMAGRPGHVGSLKFLTEQIAKINKQSDRAGTLIVDEFVPDIDFAIKKYEQDFSEEILGKYSPESAEYKIWSSFTANMKSTLLYLKEVKGTNLIWEKKGYKNPEQILLLGANYDSVGMNKENYMVLLNQPNEGADNNASGVAILLSMMELFSQMDFPFTIRLGFFDFGEFQSLGTYSYVNKYLEEQMFRKNFLGFVDLLMLGHDSISSDKQKQNGNMKLYLRGRLNAGYQGDYALAERLVSAGKKIHPAIQFFIMPNDFKVSGHTHFWQKGVPAIVFTQDWENDSNELRNHTADDFVESLNMKTLCDAFYYIAGSVISFANNIIK